MMEFKYCVVKEKYLTETKEYVSFGIAAVEIYDGIYHIITTVHNCCSNIDIASELVEKCNRLKLSPVHLNDIVMDFLNDF